MIDGITSRSPKLALNPGMAAYYVERAVSYLGTRNDEKAMADLNKAIQLNPKSGKAFWVRSAIYCDTNRLELAKRDEAQVTALGGKLDKQCAAAPATVKQAERVVNKPVVPVTAKGWFDKGEQHMEDMDLTEAVEAYTQAIALKSGYAEAYGKRANAHFAGMGQTEGFADINKAIALDPANYVFYLIRSGFHCFRWEAVEDQKALASAKRDEAKVIQLGGKVERPCK